MGPAATVSSSPQLKNLRGFTRRDELNAARHEPAAALDESKLAQSEGRGHYPEWEGLFIAANAHARLGSHEVRRSPPSPSSSTLNRCCCREEFNWAMLQVVGENPNRQEDRRLAERTEPTP